MKPFHGRALSGALATALVLTPFGLALPAAAEPAPATTTPQQTGTTAPPEVTDRLIVKYERPLGAAEKERIVGDSAREADVPEAEETTEVKTTADDATVVELTDGVGLDAADRLAEKLAADPAVAYAEPDRLVSVAEIPGMGEAEEDRLGSAAATAQDPGVPSMWALGSLDAFRAWDTATGRGVTIGVVDTGFANHPDLDSQVIGGYDFVSTTNLSNDGDGRDADPRDPGTYSSYGQCYAGSPASSSIWHGTHVAGTAAAKRDSYGTVGIAPDATLLNARALGACGTGYVSDMADAVSWLAGNAVGGAPAPRKRADVINMSLSMKGSCPAVLQNAISTAWNRGIPVAVAAGNWGEPAIDWAPGNCYDVVTVGAITSAPARAGYSNHGGAVDIYAPGHRILSSFNTGARGPAAPTTSFNDGTSMASPHVAGTLALLKQKNPTLSADQYKQKILDSGDPFIAEGKTLNTHDALYLTPDVVTPQQGYTVKGAINTFYQANRTLTGAPTANEQPVAGGWSQTFQKGTVYWSPATGAQLVKGGIRIAYDRNGGAGGALGFPTSGERSNGAGGYHQFFQKGRIVWGPATDGFAVRNGINDAYAGLGSEKGPLGYPTSEERANGAGGYYQSFEKGRIVWSTATGSQVVKGAIASAYAGAGAETGALGYPTAGERATVNGGWSQAFQNGTIHWSPATGAHAVKGAIGVAYRDLGAERTRLGYPVAGESFVGGRWTQRFQGGTISWRSGTGIEIVYG